VIIANADRKTSQKIPPNYGPEKDLTIRPHEILTHGRKKQIKAIIAPAGVRNTFLSSLFSDTLLVGFLVGWGLNPQLSLRFAYVFQ